MLFLLLDFMHVCNRFSLERTEHEQLNGEIEVVEEVEEMYEFGVLSIDSKKISFATDKIENSRQQSWDHVERPPSDVNSNRQRNVVAIVIVAAAATSRRYQ